MGRQEEPTSSRPYAFACDERKGKKKAPTPSSSSEEEEEEESDDDEDNKPSTLSSKDEEIIQRVGKVMGDDPQDKSNGCALAGRGSSI
jgi:hypothetical protein